MKNKQGKQNISNNTNMYINVSTQAYKIQTHACIILNYNTYEVKFKQKKQ